MNTTSTSKTLISQPKKPWQAPVECAKCHDVIWSSYSGEFVWCKCKAIAVDQTQHYARYTGNREDFIFPENNIKDQI